MAKKGRPPKKRKRLKGGPPKLSAYNRFVKRFMKGRKGKATANMKAAARAWRAQGKTAKPSVSRAKTGKRRGGRSISPRKKYGGRKMAKGGFNSQKLMKFIRLIALGSPAIAGVAQHGFSKEAAVAALKGWTGVNVTTGQFNGADLAAGWIPYLAAVGTTYGIPKLAGLIRSM